ncbi:MAG TPA: hypothetical protein VGE11_06620 [Pseudonocardia sp.]
MTTPLRAEHPARAAPSTDAQAHRELRTVQQSRRNVGPPALPDEVTVHLPRGANPTAPLPADEATVLVPGALLAPAPTPQVVRAGEAPVFVDDSGTRKRLLRLAGVLIALLSIGFIGIVGVALAVPDVATSVGLGNVVPFIVPGAAALPALKAASTSQPQVAALRPKPRPVVVAAPTAELAPVVAEAPTTAPVARTSAPATTVAATSVPATVDPTAGATLTAAPTTAAAATVTNPPTTVPAP